MAWPLSGACRPDISDSSVLLPQPEGPEIRLSSLGYSDTDRPCSTCTLTMPDRKDLHRRTASRLGAVRGAAVGAGEWAFITFMGSGRLQRSSVAGSARSRLRMAPRPDSRDSTATSTAQASTADAFSATGTR